MSKRRRGSPIKFKRRDGVIGFPREVVRSDAYRDLSGDAKALLVVLQDVWRPSATHIHYSVRRVGEALGIGKSKAARALKEVQDHGFVRCVEESDWLNGQARVYQLTWMTESSRAPPDDWKNWPFGESSKVPPAGRSNAKPSQDVDAFEHSG